MHAHIHAATSGRGMGGRVDSQRNHGGEGGGGEGDGGEGGGEG